MPQTRIPIETIGQVRNEAGAQEHLEGFRKVESEIVLKKPYVDGLKGLIDYSHVTFS